MSNGDDDDRYDADSTEKEPGTLSLILSIILLLALFVALLYFFGWELLSIPEGSNVVCSKNNLLICKNVTIEDNTTNTSQPIMYLIIYGDLKTNVSEITQFFPHDSNIPSNYGEDTGSGHKGSTGKNIYCSMENAAINNTNVVIKLKCFTNFVKGEPYELNVKAKYYIADSSSPIEENFRMLFKP